MCHRQPQYQVLQKNQVRISLLNYPVLLLDDLPIALRKEKRTCIQHPLFNFASYSYLSASFHSFISSLDSHLVLKNVLEALSISYWTQAMQEKITV